MKILVLVSITMICSGAWAQNNVKLKLDKQYVHLPVSYDGNDETRLQLIVENEAVREFDIFLPDANPDFWVFLDVSEFGNKKATLKTRYGEVKKGLDLIYVSDNRTYLDNVYSEDFRPQIHFSTMRGWINDPNGLIYYDGEYHLFYQHNPYGYAWGNMHWGHAVSTDLLRWEQLPEALYPDEIGVAYSGSAVIDYANTSGFQSGDENVMVAIYTSTWFPDRDQEAAGETPLERQSIAYSNDKGRTWTKYEGNPVIGNRRELLGTRNDRDPNVFWHEPTQKWVMILFERIGFSIFNSDNLKDWQQQSHFETFWECPELFELPIDGNAENTKWVVYDAGGDYVLGDFDGKEFKVTSGAHNYINGEFFAAQTYENIPEEDGRRIQLGWGTIQSPGMPFNMMMAFPTELTLRTTAKGVRMFNEPVAEIEELHSKVYSWENISGEQANEHLKNIETDVLHVKCVIDNISTMGYNLGFGQDELSYTIRNNTFVYRDEELIFKYIPENGSNEIIYEIIIDRTSIEVFVDNGRLTMILPRTQTKDRGPLSFSPDDERINIKSLEVFEMKSIWDK
jgi:fructan beta-fructosidase